MSCRLLHSIAITVLVLPAAIVGQVTAQQPMFDATRASPGIGHGTSALARTMAQEEPRHGFKSRQTAFLWSFLGTAVPLAAVAVTARTGSSAADESVLPGLVALGAILLGPSLGHFYAGRPGRAFSGIGVRAVAVAGTTAAFAAAWSGNEGGDALFLAGMCVLGGTLVWDIIRAPHSATVHNERLRRSGLRIALAPSPGVSSMRLGVSLGF